MSPNVPFDSDFKKMELSQNQDTLGLHPIELWVIQNAVLDYPKK